MGKRYEATGVTLDSTRKHLTRALVAAYLKQHPGGHARVVSRGNATWLKPDEEPSPSWSSKQLQEMSELAMEFEMACDVAPENAVLLWEASEHTIFFWFQAKPDDLVEG